MDVRLKVKPMCKYLNRKENQILDFLLGFHPVSSRVPSKSISDIQLSINIPYWSRSRTLAITSSGSGNLYFLGGPFPIPDQMLVLLTNISKDPRFGLPSGFKSSLNA